MSQKWKRKAWTETAKGKHWTGRQLPVDVKNVRESLDRRHKLRSQAMLIKTVKLGKVARAGSVDQRPQPRAPPHLQP